MNEAVPRRGHAFLSRLLALAAGWGFVFAFFLLPLPAGFAGEPLGVTLHPVAIRSRSNAPMQFDAILAWNGSNLLRGRLEIVFRDGPQILGRFRSDEIVLPMGEQRFHLMTPPVATSSFFKNNVTADIFFSTPRERYVLDYQYLSAPGAEQRWLVMGLSSPGETTDPQILPLLQSLFFEKLRPETPVPDNPLSPESGEPLGPGAPGGASAGAAAERKRLAITTSLARIVPEEMPVVPLEYCSFDLVFLPERGFALLKEKQLQAIRRWVEAGGSVCVLPGQGLEEWHEAFLNNLAGAPAEKPAFVLTDKGGIRPVRPEGTKPAALYPVELGRAAVVLAPPQAEEALSSPSWRSVSAFLWKLRFSHGETVTRLGAWDAKAQRTLVAKGGSGDNPYGQYYGQYYSEEEAFDPASFFGAIPINTGDELVRSLLPQNIRPIRFSLILWILLAFVVVIGPVDYFLLGRLRLRKFTWVFFPLATLGFTLFTIALANHYMGIEDHRRGVVFVDVGQGGRPLRQTAYRIHFASQNQSRRTDLRRELFAPMDVNSFTRYSYYYYARQTPDADLDRSEENLTPWFEGEMPAFYSVSQALRQWKPQLNRSFTLEGGETCDIIDWEGFRTALFEAPGKRRDLCRQLLKEHPRVRGVYLFTGDHFYVEQEAGNVSSSFLRSVCARETKGLFSVVSRIAPNGAPNFEDLSILDSSDPGQWLLVIAEQRGDDTILYRRLYR
ncbi:MAG: hypothetical protein V1918_03315 [Planctomycetota bacterium]